MFDSDYPQNKYEIIVVDDGLLDETASVCQQFSVKMVRQNDLGLNSARNAGIRAANGEIIAFVDEDVLVTRDWLHTICKHFQSDAALACLGGIDIAVPDDPYFGKCASYQDIFFRTYMHLNDPLTKIKGCNMVFRKQALKEIGMFNMKFKAYDDTELVERMNEKDMKILFDPQLIVFHHTGGFKRSLRKQLGQAQKSHLYTWKYVVTGYGKSYRVHYLTISVAFIFLLLLLLNQFLFLLGLLCGIGALVSLSILVATRIPKDLRFVPGISLIIAMQATFSIIRGIYAAFVRISRMHV